MKYKGFEIRRTVYQGVTGYIVPELTRQGERREIAGSLKTARKWVDMHLWDCYTGGINVFTGKAREAV